MKRIRLVFVLLIFPLSIIFSQNLEYKNGIGISGRIGNGDLLNDRDFDMANSSLLIDLNYSRNLTSWLDVKIPLGVAMTMNNTVEDKLLGFHGDILFQLGLFDRTRIAAPYLYLGPSFNLSKDFVENSYSVFDIAARAGLGVDFRITDNLLVGLNAGYTNTFEENQKGSLEAGLGITYLFGQGATGKGKMSMNKLKKLDSDGDGIPDIQDECPHTAGVAAFNGCPDKDNDGIPDYQDKCPDEAGSRTTMGCPDKDGDGVPDKDDKCPDIAGDAKYSGCPFIDSDGDGVPDGEDLCPDQKGLVRYQGCPDTDGDGVPDNLDQCKDKAGPAETNGCPDTDGDGIPDIEDKCPTVAGIPELNGCPAANQADLNILTNVSRNIKWQDNAFALSNDARNQLDKIVSLLKKNKKYKLTVIGYSDSDTPKDQITSLSNARADEVKGYLVSKGIEEQRIIAKGGNLPKISTRKILFEVR